MTPIYGKVEIPVIGSCLVCGKPATWLNDNLVVCFDCIAKQTSLQDFLRGLLCSVCNRQIIPTCDYVPPLPKNYVKCNCGHIQEVKPKESIAFENIIK